MYQMPHEFDFNLMFLLRALQHDRSSLRCFSAPQVARNDLSLLITVVGVSQLPSPYSV